MSVEHWWNDIDRVQTEILGWKTCPSVTSYTTYLTWTGLGSKPRLRGSRPATTRLSLDMNYIQRLGLYRAVNTLRLGYKKQSLKIVYLFLHPYKTHKYTLWAERGIFMRIRKLRKATVSFDLPVHKEEPGSHWTGFHEIWYLIIFFENLLRKSKCL